MEYAPLRPVPLTPAGPVDPERARAHVAGLLPGLAETHARALALVVIAGRSRPGAAAELSLSEPELSRRLALARNALRRSIRPLEGSGWCTRAEALVSDRLDGVLADPGARRLDVHLRNCPRCVEHERRLIQGQNNLVAAFGRAPAEAEPAALTLVQPETGPAPAPDRSLASVVAVASGALVLLAALLVIAAIVFALVAVLGL